MDVSPADLFLIQCCQDAANSLNLVRLVDYLGLLSSDDAKVAGVTEFFSVIKGKASLSDADYGRFMAERTRLISLHKIAVGFGDENYVRFVRELLPVIPSASKGPLIFIGEPEQDRPPDEG